MPITAETKSLKTYEYMNYFFLGKIALPHLNQQYDLYDYKVHCTFFWPTAQPDLLLKRLQRNSLGYLLFCTFPFFDRFIPLGKMRNKNENSRKLSGNFSRALLKSQGYNKNENFKKIIRLFSRVFLKAYAIGMLIACITMNRNLNKNLNSIQEQTSGQDKFWIFKTRIKPMKAYQSFP